MGCFIYSYERPFDGRAGYREPESLKPPVCVHRFANLLWGLTPKRWSGQELSAAIAAENPSDAVNIDFDVSAGGVSGFNEPVELCIHAIAPIFSTPSVNYAWTRLFKFRRHFKESEPSPLVGVPQRTPRAPAYYLNTYTSTLLSTIDTFAVGD